MPKPLKTKYVSSSGAAIELAWKLKNLTERHDLGQRRIMEAARDEGTALTTKMQAEQIELFSELTKELGVDAEVYGDGAEWALNIANLDQDKVALVHCSEVEALRGKDDCDCPTCQLRRTLMGSDDDDDDEPVVADTPAKDRMH